MNTFTISSKSAVLFGEGSSANTGGKLKELCCSKVLCIYDKGVKNSGIADKIIDNILASGIAVVRYDEVLPDPPDYIVDAAAKVGREENVDGIVAIGGGSTIDVAKAVNVLLPNLGSIRDWFGKTGYRKSSTPLVLIPTTAGTGSDITALAVITNTSEGRKAIVRGSSCVGTLSIIDPSLTVGLLPYPTAATGMDTFAHAAESLTSKGNPNPISCMFGEKAISLAVKYLPLAVKNGSDMEARYNMSLSCLLAGTAFNDATVHIGHGIAHAIGARYHVPHGIACGVILPYAIKFVCEEKAERVGLIGQAMGLNLRGGISAKELGKAVSNSIIDFTRQIGIPSLRELKVERSGFAEIADLAMCDTTYNFIPRPTSREDIIELLEEAYTV